VEGRGIEPGFEVTAGFGADITLGAVAGLVGLAAAEADCAVLGVRCRFEIRHFQRDQLTAAKHGGEGQRHECLGAQVREGLAVRR